MCDASDVSINEILFNIVCIIVDHPDEVEVAATWGDFSGTLTVKVHADDFRTLIGKGGRTIRSIRVIIGGMGRKLDRRLVVVVEDVPIPGNTGNGDSQLD